MPSFVKNLFWCYHTVFLTKMTHCKHNWIIWLKSGVCFSEFHIAVLFLFFWRYFTIIRFPKIWPLSDYKPLRNVCTTTYWLNMGIWCFAHAVCKCVCVWYSWILWNMRKWNEDRVENIMNLESGYRLNYTIFSFTIQKAFLNTTFYHSPSSIQI